MVYSYNAQVARVVDGDTVILNVDLGFHVWLREQSFRLLGINAREHADVGGPEATANLNRLLPVGTMVTLSSDKPDKYGGRYDGVITLADGRDLSHVLVQDGWAASWTGAGTKPVPPWPRTATS
jgi:endonuclease YncB( thermonuclease family)